MYFLGLHVPSDVPEIAHDLQRAIDGVVEGVPYRALRAAASALSDGYRHGDGRTPGGAEGSLAQLAYVATRMPATVAALRAVCREVRERCPDLTVETLLDLGAGPGSALWAAHSIFPSLAKATLVEPDARMVTIARQLLARSALKALETSWAQRLDPDANVSLEPSDLVVTGYLLTELTASARVAAVTSAWHACRGAMVVVTPGSTRGFTIMLEARDQLLSLGGSVVAPCPHAEPCPLPSDDWCHFGVRVNRSSLHRRLKGGVLPYEDEKYAYVVVTRAPGSRITDRVIRRPQLGDRKVTLRICGSDGIRDELVPRSHGPSFRRARKLKWGDAYDGE